jgi:hypothetical protein
MNRPIRIEKSAQAMPLTRSFRETVQARARRDVKFRQALLGEAMQMLLDGNLEEGAPRCDRASTPPSGSKNSAQPSAYRPRA